jgi:hypothetical protein
LGEEPSSHLWDELAGEGDCCMFPTGCYLTSFESFFRGIPFVEAIVTGK